jgi:hypothetical protein
MAFRTFGDLNNQLKKELDLEGEEFIAPSEMIGYWNHGVSIAESHIITLGLRDKYFLSRATIDTVQGQELYDLPTNIYANKIIRAIYLNGGTFYTIRPLDSKEMFENYQYLNSFSSTDFYRYMITHSTPGVEKFVLVPAARETATGVIKLWYYRDANRYALDSDVCDLPEIAYEFLHAYVREQCYGKESHVNYDGAKEDRQYKEQLMQSVLSGQIQDSELSLVEMDLSVYQEST